VPIDLIEHGIDHIDRREIFASITSEQLGDRQEGGGILWRFGYDAAPAFASDRIERSVSRPCGDPHIPARFE
jgi:hypothetical protein